MRILIFDSTFDGPFSFSFRAEAAALRATMKTCLYAFGAMPPCCIRVWFRSTAAGEDRVHPSCGSESTLEEPGGGGISEILRTSHSAIPASLSMAINVRVFHTRGNRSTDTCVDLREQQQIPGSAPRAASAGPAARNKGCLTEAALAHDPALVEERLIGCSALPTECVQASTARRGSGSPAAPSSCRCECRSRDSLP